MLKCCAHLWVVMITHAPPSSVLLCALVNTLLYTNRQHACTVSKKVSCIALSTRSFCHYQKCQKYTTVFLEVCMCQLVDLRVYTFKLLIDFIQIHYKPFVWRRLPWEIWPSVLSANVLLWSFHSNATSCEASARVLPFLQVNFIKTEDTWHWHWACHCVQH